MGERLSTGKGPTTIKDCLTYNITLVDLIEWQKTWLLESKGKSLTQEDFVRQYRKTFPRGDATGFAKNVFRVLDSNGDGSLDVSELVLGMSLLASDDLERKIDWAFMVYDENGDGYISRSELRKLVMPILKMQTREKLSKADLEEQVNDLFRAMNTNCDAGISIREFRDGCLKYPYLFHNISMHK